MKKITFCYALLLMAILSSFGQVQIGDGTTVNSGLPFEPSRNYSYTQSIYLASEILATGNITSLQWYYAGGYNLENSQSVTIYVGHTTKTQFASNSDWVTAANLTEVYSGGIAVNGAGWVNLQFEAPFTYNGTDNLVIAVRESSPYADTNEDDFYAYTAGSNRSISVTSNNTVPNPQSPSNGTRSQSAPILILEGINQACPKPTDLLATDPTTTGISLYWTSNVQNPSGSDYYISTSNTAPTPTTQPTGSVASGQIAIVETGLLPATKYNVWVRDICEGGPGVWSNRASFTTACETQTAFTQNFNSTTGSSVPVCWSAIVFHPQGALTDASVKSTGEDGNTGRSIEFSRNGDLVSDLYLVLPPVSNLGDGTHRLRFFAKHAMFITSGGFKIGTLDDNTPGANFSEVGQMTTTGTFTEYIIDFTATQTDDQYIAIKLDSSQEFFLGYIDDVRWEAAPLCPDVAQINVPVATTTTATIAWSSSEDVEAWDVVYSTSSTTDPTTLTPLSATNTPSAQINDLTPETTYYVWVRSKCEAGIGFWVGPISFKTACMPVNTLIENFDATTGNNLPNCWSKILRGPSLSPNASIKTVFPEAPHSAPKAVEMSTNFPAPTTDDDIILVSPNLGNLSSGTHRLKFYARGAGNLQIGTLPSNTNAAEFSYFTDVFNVSTTTMTQYVIDFSNYNEGNSYIGIRYNTGSAYVSMYIDDIIWEPVPACPDVTNVSVDALSTTEVGVGWALSAAPQWQVAYGLPSITNPENATLSPLLNSAGYEIPGLLANTVYKVWVRSVCGDPNGNGAWTEPILVKTFCDAVTEFTETFESTTTDTPEVMPSCWSSILRGDTIGAATINAISWQPYAGTKCIELSNAGSTGADDMILVSPNLSNLSSGTHQLKFYARHSDTANLEIGTLNGNSDYAIFSYFADVTLTPDYQLYTVDFTAYQGTDTFIGIRMHSTDQYKAVQLDNVVWEPAPSCSSVSDVTVVATTTTTADITWIAGSSETGWQYVYAESTITNPATLTPSVILDTENAQLTNLTSNTSYNVWVRSVCTGNAFGSWIGPIPFMTSCLASGLPYIENFESVTTPALPNCSSLFNSVDDVNWTTVSNPGNGFNSKTLAYGPNDNNTGDSWFFTQGLTLTTATNYTISYKYGNNSTGLAESLKIKSGTAENPTAMTIDIADHPTITGGTAETNSVNFTVPADGVYYFGFQAYSASNQWQLFVDDIKVDTALSNGGFENANFTFYPNPVKNVLTLSYKQNISSVAVYNLLGQKVLEKNTDTNSTQIDMSGLSSGHYMVKVTSENQTKIVKIIKE